MRHFFSEEDLFEILTPFDWVYRPNQKCTYDFGLDTGEAFQISITYLDTKKHKNKADKLLESSRKKNLPKLYNFHQLNDIVFENNYTCRMWVKKQASKFIKISITGKRIDDYLEQVKISLKSFRLVKTKNVEYVKKWYRFGKFLEGIAAMFFVLDQSLNNKCHIESICAQTNLTDAYLRCALILKNQINKTNKDIDIKWIYQGLDDKAIPEKRIYDEAFRENIINDNQLELLYKLYDERNRVIHRFIISEISYIDIEDISYRCRLIFEEIWEIVKDLENQQIKLSIGMTKDRSENESDFDHKAFIKEKLESFTLSKY